jgi:putative membrane protein
MKNHSIKSKILRYSIFCITLSPFAACSGGATKSSDATKMTEEYNEKKFDDENTKMDAQFLISAAEINLEEIKLGQLAQQNGGSSSVKEMGKMMEDAHTQSYNELTVLAQNKIVTIPTEMNANGTAFYNKMNGKSGVEFDKEYTEIMIQDHKKAIELFESASNTSRDAEVKQFATKTLPVLQNHLNTATANQR